MLLNVRSSLVFDGVLIAVTLLSPTLGVAAEYTTLDCPGASASWAVSINNQGQIAGSCNIIKGNQVAFVYFRGVYNLLSVPKGNASIDDFIATESVDINDSGVLLGTYFDRSGGPHGFVFNAGLVTKFDPPGSIETDPAGISASGEVAGTFVDEHSLTRGFIRDLSGNLTTFTVPGARVTQVAGINNSGQVTGAAWFGSTAKGFIRDAEGSITMFDAPGETTTLPVAINNSGQVVGWAFDHTGKTIGFTRDAVGAFTTFIAPGVGSKGIQTTPVSINDSGVVVGWAQDPNGAAFSFTQSGTSAAVDFQFPASQPQTTALKVNATGRIAGFYLSGASTHGFFRDVLAPGK